MAVESPHTFNGVWAPSRPSSSFLALCGLWSVMTPPDQSTITPQMHSLHSHQLLISLTNQTFSLPMQSLTSFSSASTLSDSSLQSQSSCPSPRCFPELPFHRAVPSSFLSEPIWYLKKTSYNLQHLLIRLTLRIMNVTILNSRIVSVQSSNNNFKATYEPYFSKACWFEVSLLSWGPRSTLALANFHDHPSTWNKLI